MKQPSEPTEIEQIEDAERDLKFLREKWLRRRGWAHICDTPGSYWLWCKEIHGRAYTTGAELAINLQRGAYTYGWETDPAEARETEAEHDA